MSLWAKAVKHYSKLKYLRYSWSIIQSWQMNTSFAPSWEAFCLRASFTILLQQTSKPVSICFNKLLGFAGPSKFFSCYSSKLPLFHYVNCFSSWSISAKEKLLLLALAPEPFQMNLSISAKAWVITLSRLLHSHSCSDQGPPRLAFSVRDSITSSTSGLAFIPSTTAGTGRRILIFCSGSNKTSLQPVTNHNEILHHEGARKHQAWHEE